MLRRALPLLIFGLFVASLAPSAGGQDSLESELLSLINGGRESPLVAHSGLRFAGREHSREMSDDGGLNHNGAQQRINNASPDPAESNGAPDDGFTGTWCENTAYVKGAPEHEVAQRMYTAWTNSPSHNRCMNHRDMTAAGVGMYYDASTNTWWATLESVIDRTLPGASPAEETPAPSQAPTQPPQHTEPPEPTERPEPAFIVPTERPEPTPRPGPTAAAAAADPLPGGDLAALAPGDSGRYVGALSRQGRSGQRSATLALDPARPSSVRESFGWPEVWATIGVIALAAEMLRRLSRRRPTP